MKILLKYQERVWYNKNKASPKGEALEKIRRTLMTNTQELYTRWLSQPDLDDAIKAELVSVAGDNDAIADRFYRDLAFGTGGLRGVIGAGTNRMNLYTVRKATQGLADYLNASGLPKKVAIAHDSRHNGELFARETARVLAANGITAYVYPRLEPTPALSWAVRYLGCGAGVCVTASHNPAKYNGYKVYGADGCQITLEAAEKILAAIEKIDCFDGVLGVPRRHRDRHQPGPADHRHGRRGHNGHEHP